MAANTPMTIVESALPLIERSVNVIDSTTSLNRLPPRPTDAYIPGYLYRKCSFSNRTYGFCSSETLASRANSIYNAETIHPSELSSQDQELQGTKAWLHSEFPCSPLSTVAFGSNTILRSSQHRKPQSQFNHIVIPSSTGELRKYVSIARLQPSPVRALQTIRPQFSVHSIHPQEARDTTPVPGATLNPSRIRSFSLNDLDCLPRSDTREVLHSDHTNFSSSSEEVLRATRLCPTFPCRPVYSPPFRCLTPPGLPSFGTEEALEYRLTQPSASNRVVEILRKWLGRDRNDSNEIFSRPTNSVDASILSASTSPPAQNLSSSPPVSLLKRVLGVSRFVESPPQPKPNARAALPPGVRVVPNPGPLAQADDGTFVRGRWGGRLSAHGVGAREINAHPMAIAAGLQSIDEIVREIDKACGSADAGAELQHTVGTRPIEETVGESITPAHAVVPNRHPEAAETRSQSNHSYPIDLQQFRTRPISFCGPVDTGLPGRPLSVSSPSRSLHMVEPSQILPTLPGRSACRDSMARFRDYVEQGEHEQARTSHESRTHEKNRCDECWDGFWSICCGHAKHYSRSDAD